MWEAVISKVNLNSSERSEIEGFLEDFDLNLDTDVEYTLCARINGEIVGTCSAAGRVLKCFAVRENLQGEGIAAKLITNITNYLFDRGIYETFIFTKPKNKNIFKGLGYKEVEEADGVILLEGGFADVNKYVDKMFKSSGLGNGEKSALVVNCNPFTLGHRYLIEKASKESSEVVVFVVEENKSLFPFNVRLQLVKKGVEDLKNVHVLPGGYYIISSATFPSYFLRKEDERLRAYTQLDARIFGRYIAEKFNIKKRYVGTEPYCRVTDAYNKTLMEVLPRFNVEVEIVERIMASNDAISASSVRRLIKENNLEAVSKIVPESTYDFLISDEGKGIIEKIKGSDSPH